MKNDDFMEELFRESESLRAEKSFKLENVLKALKKEERLQGYEILQEPFTQTGGHALVFSLQEKNKLGKVGVLKVAAKSHWDKLRHEKQILETLLGKKCFIQLEKFYEEIPFLGSTLHALFLKPYCPSNLRREYQSPDKKDLKIFLRWILEIARALEVFHSQGSEYIHRDIKPENILIDSEGKVRVGDFGIAADPQLSRIDTKHGSFIYSSPEQRRGESSTYSDIYSLGVVLYEALHLPISEFKLSKEFTPSRGSISTTLSNCNNEFVKKNKKNFQELLEKVLLSKEPQKRGSAIAFGNCLKELLLEKKKVPAKSAKNSIPLTPAKSSLVQTFESFYDPQGNIDMTSDRWCFLKVEEQIQYSKEYQQHYANTYNQGIVEKKIEGIELRLLPPGKYWQGEKKRKVQISQAFWCGKYPIAQKQWKRIMKTDPSFFKGEERPIETVSWDECRQFCEKTGFQLLTEAQWEYACRAGTTTPYPYGKEFERNRSNSASYWAGKDLMDLEDWKAFGFKEKWKSLKAGTSEVTLFEKQGKNAFGLCDMIGNIWEYCRDYYGEYSGEEVQDPLGQPTGLYRVFRGGSWDNDARYCCSFVRSGTPSLNYCFHNLGFRVSKAFP